jgi:hypothetical protein
MTGFGHQRPRAAHQRAMTTPPVAPESGEPVEVPEPQFVALMRRLGMGTLTFDVPRMGQQGSVPVSEFLDEIDRWILSRVDALIEPRLVEQVEAQVAERIEAAIEAAVAERTPQIIEDAFQRVRNDLTGAQPDGEVEDDCGCADENDEAAEVSTPQQSRFAAAAEGLTRVSFWSNVEERIVVRYVESLDAELTEWNEDCADPNEDAPLWTADVLIAFGDDVSDERLAVLTKWAFDLLEEDVVAYAGPPNLTTPRLTAEGQDIVAHDGIEALLDMAASETRPRETILPPAETGPARPGSPGFEPVMVAFWNEDQQQHISDVYESLEDGDERFQHGEIAFADADRLVHFGDVSTKDLIALTAWAEGLIEEVTVGISGMPVDDPRFIDGIQGVIDYMVDRTGDPASTFTPPTLPSTESAQHATDGLIAAVAAAPPVDPTSVGATPIPREGIFGDMASVMTELGMPEAMIDALLSEEKRGLDLFAEMGNNRPPGITGPVMASYWSVAEEKYVVREVESLEAEFDDYQAGDQTLADANTVLAFGLVSPDRLLQLTTWAFHILGGDLDLIGYAGPASMVGTAVDGIPHVMEAAAELTGKPIAECAPPEPDGDVDPSALDPYPEYQGHNPYPSRPLYTPLDDSGDLSTDPFAVILVDQHKWGYNGAFVSSDAAILHRIQHDQSMPHDEVLMEVVEDMTSVIKDAQSQSEWWRKVNESLDGLGIGEDRRFEGIYY